jgi:hypothetical protein
VFEHRVPEADFWGVSASSFLWNAAAPPLSRCSPSCQFSATDRRFIRTAQSFCIVAAAGALLSSGRRRFGKKVCSKNAVVVLLKDACFWRIYSLQVRP